MIYLAKRMLEKIELLLQQKLHNHSNSQFLNLEILLSLHSFLKGYENIPSLYFTKQSSSEDFVNKLFFVSEKDLILKNKLNIKKLNINPFDLKIVPINKRKQLLNLIEDIISFSYGEGVIYYDYSRVTAFKNDNILNFISENNIFIESNLLKILSERETKKKIFTDRYYKCKVYSKHFSWQSITELALLEKLNSLWQGFWGASEVYKLFSEDDKLIHSLIIKKELT
jgi:hypothetical protein